MKKLLLFRHESWIEAPHLTELLSKLGIPYEVIKVDEGETIPNDITNDIGGLVFWGGTMSVNDRLPWIQDELNLIRLAHQRNTPVLGHYLGSQLNNIYSAYVNLWIGKLWNLGDRTGGEFLHEKFTDNRPIPQFPNTKEGHIAMALDANSYFPDMKRYYY